MKTYLALFVVSTIASLVITPLIRRLCERFDLLDVPLDDRRVHTKAIPRLGGVAIFLSCLVALSALPFVDNLLTQNLRGYRLEMMIAVVPATLVLLLGIYDDIRGANATVKFVALGLIATLFYVLGGRIANISIPLVGSVHLPLVISYVLTVFWLVGIANAFNLIDGMDGLATGAALFSSLVILAVAIAQGHALMIVAALVLCGSLSGFLRYNFNPASIFLGDSGALFSGFMLAALAVLSVQKATTAVAVVIPILAFGLPVVDTSVTMARRLVSNKPLFQGDNEHIHHMLLARGWSQRQAALVLYSVCAAFGLLALLFSKTSSPTIGLGLFVVGVVVSIAVSKLRYHEVDELKAGVIRSVGDRRIKVANNIRVRRASVSLSKASHLNQVFEALGQMLEFGEFAYANAWFGKTDSMHENKRTLENLAENPKVKLQLRDDRIYWSWARDDNAGTNGSLTIEKCWCVRLPLRTDSDDWGAINFYREFGNEPLLVDMTYLSDLFRRNLAEAVERVMLLQTQPVMTEVAVLESKPKQLAADKRG